MDAVSSRLLPGRRVVFLDIDGTILEHGLHIDPSTPDAIRAAGAAGHLVLLSTGRSAAQLPDDVTRIGFDGEITDSGARATVGDEVVVDRPMPRWAADRLIGELTRLGIHFFLQSNEGVYASDGMRPLLGEFLRVLRERDHDGPEDAMAGLALTDPPGLAVADLDRLNKAVFVSERTDGHELLSAALGADFHVVPGSLLLPGGSNGEVNQSGTTKGSAIELVLDRLGVEAASAVGVGDSWNDVEMFEVCGTAVAMGNAADALKAGADLVTTSVLEAGIHNAFVRLGLIPR
jgi:Cof subfamily protein (haloacid dehalogenase superfamily)